MLERFWALEHESGSVLIHGKKIGASHGDANTRIILKG